jgi:hypothetical protein
MSNLDKIFSLDLYCCAYILLLLGGFVASINAVGFFYVRVSSFVPFQILIFTLMASSITLILAYLLDARRMALRIFVGTSFVFAAVTIGAGVVR